MRDLYINVSRARRNFYGYLCKMMTFYTNYSLENKPAFSPLPQMFNIEDEMKQHALIN